MARTITLSSVGTATIILDPVPRTTSVLLTAPSSGTVSIETAMGDPSTTPAGTMSWVLLSSASQMNSSNLTNGLFYTVMSPVGAVRLNCSSNPAGGTFTLKVLQAVTA